VFQVDGTIDFPIEDENDDDNGSDFDPSTVVPYDDTSDVDNMSDGSEGSSSFSTGNSEVDAEEEFGEWQPAPELALAAFTNLMKS